MKTKQAIIAVAIGLIGFQRPALSQHVEIGTGTSETGRVPTYYLFDYGWSQVIYLQSEIGESTEISGISYYVNNTPSNYEMLNQRMYLKHTTLATFPDAAYDDPATAGFTQVFQGDVTWNGSGWHEITFDTPFAYNGSDNLIVYWQNHDADYASSGPKFRYTEQSNRAKYKYADNSFPAVSGLRNNYAVNIRLHVGTLEGPGIPTAPQPAHQARNVALDNAPTLAWTNPPASDHNAVYFSAVENDVVNTSLTARVLYDGATLYNAYTHATALDHGISYYWRVLETDAEGVTTIGPVWSFTTVSAPITTFPWSEGFEHGGSIPPFWDEELVDGAHSWVFQTGGHWNEQPPTAHGGTYNAAFIHQSSGSKTRLVTPPLDLSAGNAQLTFWHVQRAYDGDQDELRVYYKNTAEGEWTLIPGAEYTSHVANWTQRMHDLPERSATYWIAFEGYDDYGYGVCIDDVSVTITDTPAPSELRAESVGKTNALLRWNGGDATSWSVEWGAQGFTPGAGTSVSNLTSESYALEGLAPGTAYDFYVISHYAGGDSDWNGPASFSTLFEAIDTFPWDEGFEDGEMPPDGWSMEFVEGAEVWYVFQENDYLEPGVPHGGDWYALFGGYDDVTRLVTRELDLSGLSAPQLSFWHLQREWDDGQDELRVYYRTSAEGEWTLLSGAVFTEEVYDWTQRTFTLPSPSSSYFIAFEGSGAGGWGVCLDDIRVEDAAYPVPSDLTLNALYSTSAEISWSGSALSYDVEWGEAGFGIGDGTRVMRAGAVNDTAVGKVIDAENGTDWLVSRFRFPVCL
jgi:hypothetical protein